MPLVGLAFALPLTLHLPFVVGLLSANDFDVWVEVSIMIVGFAHVVLAGLMAACIWAHVQRRPDISVWAMYLWVVVAGCIPGAFLYALPPIVVAVTGLPFIPIVNAAKVIAERERAASSLPRAIASK